MYAFYEFVRGPLALIAFLVFLAGMAYQIYQFIKLTREVSPSRHTPQSKEKGKAAARKAPPEYQIPRLALLKSTILGVNPFMTVMTTIFHVCLIITPIFLLAHNVLLEDSWGFSLPSLSEGTADIMTIILMLCALYFLYRRIFVPKVRAITNAYDYFVLFVAVAPFLTGFLAYHQILAYKPMLIIHILFGELMLVLIPFTKLFHIVFFFTNRFFMRSEYSLARGIRTWR